MVFFDVPKVKKAPIVCVPADPLISLSVYRVPTTATLHLQCSNTGQNPTSSALRPGDHLSTWVSTPRAAPALDLAPVKLGNTFLLPLMCPGARRKKCRLEVEPGG